MDKYLQAEKKLAELLGYCYVRENAHHRLIGHPIGVDSSEPHFIPRWSRDWSACGPLIADHLVNIGFFTKRGKCTRAFAETSIGGVAWQDVADHPDKSTAVMFAVVQAVIANLTASRDKEQANG